MEQEYRVIWEIDISAESPKEAAEKALKYMQDPESEAKHFTIISTSNNDFSTDYIDLNSGEKDG